jgi:hypothetical protein
MACYRSAARGRTPISRDRSPVSARSPDPSSRQAGAAMSHRLDAQPQPTPPSFGWWFAVANHISRRRPNISAPDVHNTHSLRSSSFP